MVASKLLIAFCGVLTITALAVEADDQYTRLLRRYLGGGDVQRLIE